MLSITIPSTELFNEVTGEFSMSKEQILQLEHSLVSLAKWESKWCKPFMTHVKKTREETIDYIRCMTITQNIDPSIYDNITDTIIDDINRYIEAPMTATTFGKENASPSRTVTTAEIVYYWMISYGIPFECQKWHINRLLTLINVCRIKNQPAKKASKKDVLTKYAALNAARRNALNTPG